MESMLWKELSQFQEKLKNKSSELERRDSELQAASQGLKATNRQVEDAKIEFDHIRSIFQREKDGLQCELEQELVEKVDREASEWRCCKVIEGGQSLQAYKVSGWVQRWGIRQTTEVPSRYWEPPCQPRDGGSLGLSCSFDAWRLRYSYGCWDFLGFSYQCSSYWGLVCWSLSGLWCRPWFQSCRGSSSRFCECISEL